MTAKTSTKFRNVTKKELIEALKIYDDDSVIKFIDGHGYGYSEVEIHSVTNPKITDHTSVPFAGVIKIEIES